MHAIYPRSSGERTVSSIEAHVGRIFEVSLYSHAGTGYVWMLTRLPHNGHTDSVALVEMDSTPLKSAVAGGPVRQTFTFVGIAEGDGTLSFQLLRPWEPGEPADTRDYEVTVKSDIEEDLRAAAGNESFPPVVYSVCLGDDQGKPMLDSRHNCRTMYGITAGLKYGIPIEPAYGVPMPMYNVNVPLAPLYNVNTPLGQLYNVNPPTCCGPIIAKYMTQKPQS
jgi:hypothetical protein